LKHVFQEFFTEYESLRLDRPLDLAKFKAESVLVQFSYSAFDVDKQRFKAWQQLGACRRKGIARNGIEINPPTVAHIAARENIADSATGLIQCVENTDFAGTQGIESLFLRWDHDVTRVALVAV
jgi:hypothetical protein